MHAVFLDMTGMKDPLLLHAKTGQTLDLCWASLNNMAEHAACLVRDCAYLAALSITFCSTPARRRRPDLLQEGSRSRLSRLNVHIRVIDIRRGVPASIRQTLFQPL
jgi:nitrogen-specific signal transduction histidine kinase